MFKGQLFFFYAGFGYHPGHNLYYSNQIGWISQIDEGCVKVTCTWAGTPADIYTSPPFGSLPPRHGTRRKVLQWNICTRTTTYGNGCYSAITEKKNGFGQSH